jgi:hypothetical protein
MRSEEYLLLAEIQYWQEMISTRKRLLPRREIEKMVRSQAQARNRLRSFRESLSPGHGTGPDASSLFAD